MGKLKRIHLVWSLVLILLLIVSCATGTDIKKKSSDGSPIWITEIPVSNRLVYGVGRSKLSNLKNSQDASYADANADLAKKLSVRVNEASSTYASDSEGVVLDAYESIKVMTVSFTMKGVVLEDRWVAEDGTVWTLVSLKIKDLPSMYEEAANNYRKEQEEKKSSTLRKLEDLLAEIGETEDEETLTFIKLASAKADSIVEQIDVTLSKINTEGVRDKIGESLVLDGYDLSEEQP